MKSILLTSSQNSFCWELCPEATAGWAGRGYPDAAPREHGTAPAHIKEHFSRLSSAVTLQRLQNFLAGFLDIERRTPELCWRWWPARAWPLAWEQPGPEDTRLQPHCHHSLGLFPTWNTVTNRATIMTTINETSCKPLWKEHNIFASWLCLLINDTIIPPVQWGDSWSWAGVSQHSSDTDPKSAPRIPVLGNLQTLGHHWSDTFVFQKDNPWMREFIFLPASKDSADCHLPQFQ